VKKLVASSLFLVIGAELLALVLHDRWLVLWTSGAAVAFVLLGVRRYLGRDSEPVAEPESNHLGDSLRRWVSTTETLIRRSESTRRDWDRHLRPMLARRFEIATGQRKAKDPAAYYAMGRMLFGAELWEWVNPDNVADTGAREPGPGREALQEILQRLEQV
jgi:hypothetical protein